jgi:hypothetical protein
MGDFLTPVNVINTVGRTYTVVFPGEDASPPVLYRKNSILIDIINVQPYDSSKQPRTILGWNTEDI